MRGQINIPNAQLGFKNFEGRAGEFNDEGTRNFVVFLEDELADELEAEGWNVKHPKPRESDKDEEDQRRRYLPVGLAFDNYPAKVVQVIDEEPRVMHEDEVGMLDWAEIDNVDLVIRPYSWGPNAFGQSGVKAYTKAIYITLVYDEFASKYGI